MADGFAARVRALEGGEAPFVEGAPTGGVVTPAPVGGFAGRVRALEREGAELRAGALAETGEDPGQLGPPGMEDFLLRADIGLSDTVEEKRLKFKEKFPDGDFIRVQRPSGGTDLLFKKTPDEPFAKVDAGAFEKFEILGDIADISGDLPAAAAEAFVTRGSKLLQQMAGVFAGTIIGDSAKEVVEEFRGYQKELVSEQAARILARAGTGALGAAGTVALSGPLNIMRGSANLKLAPGAMQAQDAARAEGIPTLMPGQVAQSPIVRKLQGQAGATVSSVKDYVQNQQRAAVQSLGRLRSGDTSKFLRGEMQKLHDDARKQIITGARLSDKKLSDGGNSIKAGIAEYDDLARGINKKNYDDARKIEAPVFEPAPARAVADDLEAQSTELGQGLAPAVQDAVKRIREFDPNAPDVELPSGAIVTNTDRLRAIRQDLWDAKTPPVGEPMRRPETQAAKLYSAITDVLKDPANTTPAFREAWGKANTEAAKRFDTLEKLMIIRAQRDETPAMLADKLARPRQVDNLSVLKETMPEGRFKEFQEAVRNDFVGGPKADNLTNRLNEFDQETLDTLFSAGEQKGLRELGTSFDELNRLNLPEILQRQQTVSGTLDSLIDGKRTGDITRLREATPRGSPANRTIRAALMDRVLRRVVESKEGAQSINSKSLRKEIKELVDTGAIRFLDRMDIRTMRNLDKVAEFLPAAADSGTSLQAGETAAALRGLDLGGGITFLENLSTARIMTSPLAQRILIGQGKAPKNRKNLRVLGAIAAQLATETQKEESAQLQP